MSEKEQQTVEDKVVWEEKPSSWSNFPIYLICLILAAGVGVLGYVVMKNEQPWAYAGIALPLVVALFSVFMVKSVQYKLTEQQFFVEKGIFTRVSDRLELYRVKDFKVVRPFFLRLVGRGNIVLLTSDKTDPELNIKAIRNADAVCQMIRDRVEQLRMAKGVREVDRGVGGDHDVVPV